MNEVAAEQTYMLAERFDKALKTIRGAVAGMDLEVAGEIDVADLLLHHPGTAARSRILLVDCPLLIFEALALDRAAAVFFPLHVILASDGARTHVATVKPPGVFDARLPAGAAEPFERLEARVARVLEDLCDLKRRTDMDVKTLQQHLVMLATLNETDAPVISCYLNLESRTIGVSECAGRTGGNCCAGRCRKPPPGAW